MTGCLCDDNEIDDVLQEWLYWHEASLSGVNYCHRTYNTAREI